MANELACTMSFTMTKGTHRESFNPGTFKVDVSGSGAVGSMIQCTSDGTNMITSDTTAALGYCGFVNIDSAINANWGVVVNSTYHEVGMLPAGKACIVAFSTSAPTIQWRSQSGTILIKPTGIAW